MNRQILRLAVPNIITNLTVPLLGMADFALMGHLKAESALYVGAIALGTTVFNVVYVSFAFLRMGTGGFTAQAYGEGNEDKMALSLQRSLLAGFVMALLLVLLQYPIQYIAFSILDGGQTVKNLARQYFYIRIYAAPATLLLYGFYGWFLGMQNAKIPMIIAITVNAVNIGLNFLFVLGFGMKSEGVALASVAAQYSGLILAFVFLLVKYKRYAVPRKLKYIAAAGELKMFFGVNGDIFIRTVLLILVLAFFTGRSAYYGEKILAVNTILFQFFLLFSYFADGFAYAGEALAGKAKGSGNIQLLHKTVRYLFRYGWAVAFLAFVAFLTGLPWFLKIMTNDVELISIAGNFSFWITVIPFTGFAAFLWDGIYIGVTASKTMRNTMIFSVLFVFLPAYYGLSYIIGNHALWLAFELFLLARGISMWVVWKKTF